MLTDELMLERIQLATLMDDPFMREFFTDNIEGTQEVLRIIMDKKDLVVKTVEVQYVLRGAGGSRYVRLDVWAEDEKGTQYDVEVQNEGSGASPQRARYNSAILDANILKPKEDYSVLKTRESVVIFITDKDVLGGGEPVYLIDRLIRKSGKPFNDGAHIIYVNSSHQDLTTELGRLMHDFKCAKPEEMLNPVISAKVTAMKGGGKKMGVWQEMKAEAIAEGRAEGEAIGETRASETIARNLLKAGKNALEEIAEACGLTLQRVQELAKTTV